MRSRRSPGLTTQLRQLPTSDLEYLANTSTSSLVGAPKKHHSRSHHRSPAHSYSLRSRSPTSRTLSFDGSTPIMSVGRSHSRSRSPSKYGKPCLPSKSGEHRVRVATVDKKGRVVHRCRVPGSFSYASAGLRAQLGEHM